MKRIAIIIAACCLMLASCGTKHNDNAATPVTEEQTAQLEWMDSVTGDKEQAPATKPF